jgi:hypothetical protein
VTDARAGHAPKGAVPDSAPFLSVLVRTQGTRPATLEDALLTLAAQTCDGFEVLVLVHDPSEATAAAIEAMVHQFHPRFAERVRVLTVVGGGRSRPLNEGARMARGKYLTMLDDDDIVFAHWVESFKVAAERGPGRVLRACVATQPVRALPGVWEGKDGYEILGRPRVDYPIAFDYLDHLVDNRTPNNGYAVPRALVVDFRVTWDESLPVLEDWDHLMRAAALCGVESAATVSALIRAWSGGSDSKTAHSRAEWEETHRRIEARHDALPVLLPRGASAMLRARVRREEAAARDRVRLEQAHQLLSVKLDGAVRQLETMDAGVAALRRALEEAEAQLAAIRSSTTWRLARPAQAAAAVVRRVVRRAS